MEIIQDLHPQSTTTTTEEKNEEPQHQRLRDFKWWFRVSLYIVFLLVGQSTANLLGRLYYDKGGNSKWMATFVQSAGFPILLPLYFIFTPHAKSTNINANIDSSKKTKPKLSTIVSLYIFFGLLLAGDNLMYSNGLLYLSLSTYSLLCATQLAFNAVFSYFLNSQKFTAFIFNSVVLLTISSALLAINNDDSEDSTNLPKDKRVLGFVFTLGASVTFSLYLSLVQLSFDKVIKSETFSVILDMQFYPSFVATCACVVGLFASGEWKSLNKEMKEYELGKVSYIMTLFWTAVTWQVSSIGMLGLVLDVSSLFSNVIGTVVLPVGPILAVIFFHDKINGVKFIALMLAIWGFLSYIYQHYLDDKKAKANESHLPQVSRGEVEIC
ncbi:putative major facilitator superfamily domain, purine permease, plant [Medicago truncatula]|uniref:Probable purine permease n=1 Tax=Medicago truncatula TaxID=3880 RepID=A0A396IJN7_MEDTR|nr:probable purine permease 11 [Medicago truncatula]RHN63137.1 putative major facilitator superfamily domain, purine permease, plant [Medicago truncatula]